MEEWPRLKRCFPCSRDTKLSDSCDITSCWIPTGLSHRYVWVITRYGPSEKDFVSAFQEFRTSWSVIPANVLFTSIQTMFSLFLLTSPLLKATKWKYSYASNAVGTVNSYAKRAFARLLSGTNCENRALLCGGTGKLGSQKRSTKSP